MFILSAIEFDLFKILLNCVITIFKLGWYRARQAAVVPLSSGERPGGSADLQFRHQG